jgi:hypothetical protein
MHCRRFAGFPAAGPRTPAAMTAVVGAGPVIVK